MSDLVPFVVGSAVTDLALLGVFLELHRRERSRHLVLWALAYALDATRHVLAIVEALLVEAPLVEMAGRALLIGAAICLLAGTARFSGRPLGRAWYAAAATALVCGVAASVAGASYTVAALAPALLLASARIFSGIELLRAPGISRWPRALAGVPLILAGLHAMNYPFVRPIPWLAPWGFLGAQVLATMVAIGILLIHSERARVEAQASARRYQELFDGSIEGIFRTSLQGRFVAANPALVQMLGYASEEELRSVDILRDVYVNPADRARILAHKDGDIDTVEVRRKDGSIIEVAVHGHRRYDEQGNVICFEGSMRDVTAEKRLREELAQAQRMEALGRMAGGIAHDFNNVLATILAAAELASLRVSRGQSIQRELEDVASAAMRASELTRQLLAFGRTQVIQRKPLDLAAIVSDSARVLGRVLPEDVAVSVDVAPGPIVVLADATQVEQIVLNVALNARDAMPGGGRLSIALDRVTESGSPWARLAITDDGAGMDDETRRRMFEPFFTTKPRGSGTGLGLSSVYGIVTQAGGRIDVESAIGRGTKVTVMLPVAEGVEVEARTEPALPSDRPHPKLRVLLVEDDAALGDLTARSLRDRGHEVEVARSAEDALEVFGADPSRFDLVVSDVVMTGASGTELARSLLARRADLPFVLVSGHAAERTEEIEQLGVRFLAKPYTSDQLLDAVARHCRAASRC